MSRKLVVGFLVVTLAVVLGVGTAIAKDKYIVGSDIPWAPFEMETPAGEFFGFDIDAIRAIAVVAGFDLEIQKIAFDVIIESVKSGKADLGVSGFTITAEREAAVDFSNPYYLSNQAVVIRKDSGLNVVTALIGKGPNKAVGAQNGTTGFGWVEDQLQANGVDVQLKGYDTYPMAILDLINKRIDAVIQDEPASQASLSAYPNDLTIAGILNTYEYFGFLVVDKDPKGILPRINAALVTLGLQVVERAGGVKELVVTPGSTWANLLKAYFGPTNEKIEAAWLKCKNLLLNAKSAEDVAEFARCLAQEATK
jgi:polar amino acid transport system substrate-binding protein